MHAKGFPRNLGYPVVSTESKLPSTGWQTKYPGPTGVASLPDGMRMRRRWGGIVPRGNEGDEKGGRKSEHLHST